MKKILILLSAVLVCAGPSAFAQVERAVSGFNKLNITGPFTVYLTIGSSEVVTIDADEADLDNIKTEVIAGSLNISVDDLKGKKEVVIYVFAKELKAVSLTGSGKLQGKTLLKSPSLEILLTGSGEMSLDLGVNDLMIGLTGSGNLTLTGQAQELKANLNGSGDINADKLHVMKGEVNIAGSGNAYVNVKGDLSGSIKGSGDIVFSGTPTIKNIKMKGSGKMRPAAQ